MSDESQEASEPAGVQGAPLSDAARRRGQSAIVRTAIADGTFMASTIRPIGSLFVLALGGSAVHVGMLRMLMQIGWFGRLPGTHLAPRTGKVRVAFIGRVAALAPLAMLVGLAASGWTGRPAVVAALLAYGLMMFCRQVGHTVWWPLVQDNTAGDAIGRFLVRLRTVLRLIEIAVPLTVGAYLYFDPSSRGFVLPLSLGLAAMAAAAFFVRRIPETPAEGATTGLWTRIRLVWRDRAVRRLLTFHSQYRLIFGLMVPFWVVMLKSAGLPASLVIWALLVRSVGNMLSLRLWGPLVDRHGGRSALNLSLAAQAALGLAWLVLPGGRGMLIAWAAGYYLLWGFLQGGAMMGNTWVLLNAVPAVYQTAGFTLVHLAGALSSAVGSMVGGVIVEYLLRAGGDVPDLRAGAIYLAAVQASLMLTWWARSRLVGFDKQVPARQLMLDLFRRMLGGQERD